MNEKEQKELREWVESRSAAVRAVAERIDPFSCYRLVDHPTGHYAVYSIEEYEDGLQPRLTLLHGADSFLPGFGVFGIDPDILIKCGCGQWELATEEQQKKSEYVVNLLKLMNEDS